MNKTFISLTYEGINITQNIFPFLLSFSYSDNSGQAADDISFSFEDRKALWFNQWLPSKGDSLTASISDGKNILPLGFFQVDQLEYSAPPRTLTIKGISIAVKNSLSNEKHSRAWENVNLSRIAQDIAGDNNLGLYFDGVNDFFFERREQSQQSDIEFLSELCGNYGASVKISDGKIIIYDSENTKNLAAVCEISSSDKKLISYKFTSKSAGIYSGAKINYHNAKKGRTISADATDDSTEGTGKTLELSTRAENESDALAIANKKLQALNAKEITGSIILAGDMRFLAGININCVDFGIFSGKYFLSKVIHNISRSGYTTTLNLEMGAQEKKKVKSKKSNSGGATLYYEGENYYRQS